MADKEKEEIKSKVLDAISGEWNEQFGPLFECDENERDKYYFMIGFVASAIERQMEME